MKEVNKVFFNENGITSTSANFLANLAKEFIAEDSAELASARFIEKTVSIVGQEGAPLLAEEGKDEDWVNQIPARLTSIAAMNTFIAWMREGIKAKEDETAYWETYSFESWLHDVKKVEMPIYTPKPWVTEDDIIGEMNVAERFRYLAVEAKAASMGQYIHLNGAINKARKEQKTKLANPVVTSGSGRDTLVFTYKASINPDVVDAIFTKEQNEHREAEKEVNSFKAKIAEEVRKRNIAISKENQAEKQRVDNELEILTEEFSRYVQERLEEVSKLKIVVPKALDTTFNYLNSLGKSEDAK